MTESPLSSAQLAFLRLHVKRFVESWQWCFGESMLRARARRRTATIRRDELDDLVMRGLVNVSHGSSVYATMAGTEAVQ